MICPICFADSFPVVVGGLERDLQHCFVCGHYFIGKIGVIEYADRGLDYWKQNCNYQGIQCPEYNPEWDSFLVTRIGQLREHGIVGETPIKIIEIGCSEGQVLEALKRVGHSVMGFEPNKVLASLRDYVQPCGIENGIVFNETADAVFSSHTYEHLTNPVKTTNKIFDVLKPGGKIYIECPLDEIDYWNPDHIHFFSESSLKKTLERFVDIKVTTDEFLNFHKIVCKQIQISGVKT